MLRWALVLSLCAGLSACKKKEPKAEPAPKAPETASASEKKAAPTANFAGRVTGVIKLKEGTALPTVSLPEQTAREVAASVPRGCPALTSDDQRQVEQHGETQGLYPVHLAVTQMSDAPPREKRTHELVIEDCRLKPGLLGVMRGDSLRVTNRSQTAFLPVLPGDNFMQAIMPGKSREMEISAPGSFDVHCGFGGYCGSSMLISVAHSLFAVTDAEGRFVIEGIPLDEDLTLHAWHPLFEVATAPFKLTKAEPSKVLELALIPHGPAPETKPKQ